MISFDFVVNLLQNNKLIFMSLTSICINESILLCSSLSKLDQILIESEVIYWENWKLGNHKNIYLTNSISIHFESLRNSLKNIKETKAEEYADKYLKAIKRKHYDWAKTEKYYLCFITSKAGEFNIGNDVTKRNTKSSLRVQMAKRIYRFKW